MKRLERLKVKKHKRRRMAVQVILAVVLVGGLAAGIMNLSVIKIWATKRYLSIRLPPIIDEELEPDLYDQLKKWHDPSQPINVLLVGIDRGSVPGESGYTRSDVMILLTLDAERKKAVLVSIPRDTKVTIPGYGTEKINAAHSFIGPAGALQAVKALSGMEIHHYAEVDFEAFKEVVDAMGGVFFHNEQTINDPKVGYLPKGDYMLTGEQALIICRSRDFPEGDLARIDNQKLFLKAAMEKMVTIRDVQVLLKILDAAVKHLQTTMQPDMIFTLGELLQGIKVEDVEFATVPGHSPTPARGQPWYYVYDELATAQLFSNVRNYCSTKTLEEQAAEQALRDQQEQQQAALLAAEAEVQRSSVGLAVLNGARKEGLAAVVADALRDKGYDNIKTDSTKNLYTETTIYYAPGHEAEARVLAKDLDPAKAFSVVQDAGVTGPNQADVVLVIGKDYTGS